MIGKVKFFFEYLHRTVDIFAKLVIPIIALIITFNLPEYQKKAQQEKHDNDLELEYVRTFYTDMTSDDPLRRQVADELLKALKPELQEKFIKALASIYPDRAARISSNIAYDKTQSAKIRSSAQNIAFTIAGQFVIKSPLEGKSVGRMISVKGKSPYTSRNHYLIITPNGKGDFITDIPVKVYADRSFVISATLGSAAEGIGEQFSLRVIATDISLDQEQRRSNKIPLDALASNSVTVFRSR